VPSGRDIDLVIVDDLARVVAERLVEAVRHGGSIVVTGGKTPRPAYELAAQLDPDWSRAELWWGDERCVPPDHEDSNYRMVKTALLDRLARPPLAVHRMPGEAGPDAGAEEYEQELGSASFDLVLLGLGPDAHVASLFPSAPTLDVDDHRVVGAQAQLEPFVDRITLTLPALCEAREVLFLVSGESKADAVARAFAGESTPEVPGSLVRSASGRTWAVLDAAAASRLPSDR
jgi:6-phosphogluconolactonase